MPNDVYVKLQTVSENIVSLTIYESAEEIEKAVKSARYKEDQWIGGVFDALVSLREIPAADVAEVRHGRWEVGDYAEPDHHGVCVDHYPGGGLYCTECLHGWKRERVEGFEYCPNCGAKMDKEEDDVHER